MSDEAPAAASSSSEPAPAPIDKTNIAPAKDLIGKFSKLDKAISSVQADRGVTSYNQSQETSTALRNSIRMIKKDVRQSAFDMFKKIENEKDAKAKAAPVPAGRGGRKAPAGLAAAFANEASEEEQKANEERLKAEKAEKERKEAEEREKREAEEKAERERRDRELREREEKERLELERVQRERREKEEAARKAAEEERRRQREEEEARRREDEERQRLEEEERRRAEEQAYASTSADGQTIGDVQIKYRGEEEPDQSGYSEIPDSGHVQTDDSDILNTNNSEGPKIVGGKLVIETEADIAAVMIDVIHEIFYNPKFGLWQSYDKTFLAEKKADILAKGLPGWDAPEHSNERAEARYHINFAKNEEISNLVNGEFANNAVEEVYEIMSALVKSVKKKHCKTAVKNHIRLHLYRLLYGSEDADILL